VMKAAERDTDTATEQLPFHLHEPTTLTQTPQ